MGQAQLKKDKMPQYSKCSYLRTQSTTLIIRNLYNYFLKINIMLCKYILVRHRNWTFLSKSHCTNHSNQQQQTPNNQLICMYSILSNTQICYSRSRCPIMMPERIMSSIPHKFGVYIIAVNSINKGSCCRHGKSLKRTLRKRLPQSQNTSNKQTNTQNSCYGVSSSLMCKNFSGWNILKHNNKLKQNSKRSNINQLLQQNKIFKSQQNQKTRTMLKLQNQIKYRMNRVFRSHHLKNTHLCPCGYQSKRLTHFRHLYLYFGHAKIIVQVLSSRGLEPLACELKARCSAN